MLDLVRAVARKASGGLARSETVRMRLEKRDRRRRVTARREHQITGYGIGRGQLGTTAGEYVLQGMASEVLQRAAAAQGAAEPILQDTVHEVAAVLSPPRRERS